MTSENVTLQSTYRIEKDRYLAELDRMPYEHLNAEETAALSQILRLPVLRKALRICRDSAFEAQDQLVRSDFTSLKGIATAVRYQGQAKGVEIFLESFVELAMGVHLSQISDVQIANLTEQEYTE